MRSIPRIILTASLLAGASIAHAQDPTPVPTPIADPNAAAAPLAIPPPPLATPSAPLKSLPPVYLDDSNDSFGIAQSEARSRGLQARMLWIDGLANIDRINSTDKIKALTAQIKNAGFNMIVLDVKPINGLTLYKSAYAPLSPGRGGKRFPEGFDPLAEFLRAARPLGLQVIASMNAFAEGQLDSPLPQSPGYANPQWQTTIYESVTRVAPSGSTINTILAGDTLNTLNENGDRVTIYQDLSKLKRDLDSRGNASLTVAVLNAAGQVIAVGNGQMMTVPTTGAPPAPPIPVPPPATAPTPDGAAPDTPPTPVHIVPAPTSKLGPMPTKLGKGEMALVGIAGASNFLNAFARLGVTMTVTTQPDFHPIGKGSARTGPLMVNPNDPTVQTRLLNMVGEVVGYGVDGIIFDDRLRYAGLNADFGDKTRADFETYVGHAVKWPDDVFKYASDDLLSRRIVPGPLMETWLLWRAITIRNFLASAGAKVKSLNKNATISVYVGSTYSDYPKMGANWAADDFSAGYRFLTPGFQKTGMAGLVDWMTTGCYYRVGPMHDASDIGQTSSYTIEAAGQFSNRAANDRTWVYAGLSLEMFNGRTEALKGALQAAAATTQGIMVFDLSHNIDQFWPVFKQAFAQPALPPHSSPGLLDSVRAQHEAHKTSGTPDPPVIVFGGASGTGL
ncbi:MAG: alpha amylase family protein [Capsulimonas sp.]|uniref:alpha amylase family protein n=1 Tax=Capsulimonas sp. TaxID=2494211 RepID=UPI00326375EC